MAAFIIVIVLPLVAIVFLLRRNRSRFWTALVVAGCVVATIALYAFPHCVASDKLSRIERGMSRVEVTGLLGQPVSTKRFSDGRSKLSYEKPFRYCNVDVFLDPADHVTGAWHDH
jgi:hypothetical protein